MFNRNGRGLSAAMASGAMAMCAGQATAQVEASWTSPVDGSWSIGGFWTGGAAPRVAGDRATIGVGGAGYTVTLDISVTLAGFSMTSDDATLAGSGGATMSVVDTLFSDASLSGIAGYSSLGRLTFAGDVCDDLIDTPLDHTGSVVEWTGTGDILLGDSTVFTHGAGSTFNIENASRLFWNGAGTQSSLVNNGKISKNSGGVSTFNGVAFTNNGDVCVLDGELELIDVGLVGPSLTMGHWEVSGDGNLNIAGAQYDSLGASVALDGPGSTFEAIEDITAITAGGALQVRNGRSFLTAGNLAVGGSLVIGQPQLPSSTFNVNGNLGNNGSVHLGNGVLSVSGEHVIGAAGSFTGNGIQFGNLTNNGLISPGEETESPNSPGQLVISSGIFEQGESGRILIEIGGLLPGLEHDVFQADVAMFDPGGDLLAGTLEVLLVGGFVPEVGDSFDVFRFTERAGEFETIEGLTQRGITFRAGFIAGALRLEVVAIPAPGALGLLGLALAAGAARRRRA
jgi:hypothetical protein